MTKNSLYVIAGLMGLIASGCNNNNESSTGPAQSMVKTDTVVKAAGISSKGIGRFKDVPLTHPLDTAMAAKGKDMFEAKCLACHKLTTEKLVGPGWKGVTTRHSPEWIMNFITNTEVMLDKDLAAQAEVVTCVVRMPNQDLSDEQARQILEFMRLNDGQN